MANSGFGAADSTTDDASSSFFDEKLPDVTSSDAPATAATKIRLLLKYLERGEIPVKVTDLRNTLTYAAQVLTTCSCIINSGKKRGYLSVKIFESHGLSLSACISINTLTSQCPLCTTVETKTRDTYKNVPSSIAAVSVPSSVTWFFSNLYSERSSYCELFRDSIGLAVPDSLSTVRDEVVREWLSTTFSRQRNCSQTVARLKPPSFRNVATTLMIGKYIENIYKDRVQVKQLQYPEGVSELFLTLDDWNFAIFEAEALTSQQPLRYIGHELFKRYNFFSDFKILPASLDAFLVAVETGYKTRQNSYHNETHGADVLQTIHTLIVSAQLEQIWLSNLELLAMILAATIHDVDHPGTTNSFQTKTMSDLAICYNDRSVLENHHLHYTFRLLKNEEVNILQGLSRDECAELRSLMIDMVLATDMSTHFDQLKNMRKLISTADSGTKLSEHHRSKVMCLLLHTADISHPGKPWASHCQWSERITEEFFRQGDWEKELSLPLSPMCDRSNAHLTESRVGFIDYIVSPLFDVCGDMLELLATSSVMPQDTAGCYSRPWLQNLKYNRQRWLTNSSDCYTKES